MDRIVMDSDALDTRNKVKVLLGGYMKFNVTIELELDSENITQAKREAYAIAKSLEISEYDVNFPMVTYIEEAD